MFRITRDPSSGSCIQCLAKITVIVQITRTQWLQLLKTDAAIWNNYCNFSQELYKAP